MVTPHVRKHILCEPDRWYYYADVHGVVVWQDMPSSFNLFGAVAQTQFKHELIEFVKSVRNFPPWCSSIISTRARGRRTKNRIMQRQTAVSGGKTSRGLCMTSPPHSSARRCWSRMQQAARNRVVPESPATHLRARSATVRI